MKWYALKYVCTRGTWLGFQNESSKNLVNARNEELLMKPYEYKSQYKKFIESVSGYMIALLSILQSKTTIII